MAVISDIAGTSHKSFNINGKNTIYQGDELPNQRQGKLGDLYLCTNGLFYAKKLVKNEDTGQLEETWIEFTRNSVPDATDNDYHHCLLYSTGETYAFAHVTYDANNDQMLELPLIPNDSKSTISKIVPSIGWCNDPSLSLNIVHRSGGEEIDGEKTLNNTLTTSSMRPKDSLSYDIGSENKRYSNVYAGKFNGTSSHADWADLAEYYEADKDYPKGTLLMFGGDKEVTIATDDVNAVVSSNPGFVLNNNPDFEHPCQIALIGRVPVRVIGKCSKFDYLQISEIPGVARVAREFSIEDEKSFSNVIARALENKDTEEEDLVLCVTKFEL